MAKTPFQDLKSEDILSAHISGLQHSVNKIEDVLNMTTSAKSGHTLVAVADQTDSSTHHIIFEGTVRNWLTSPAPKIYRNGTVIATSEYRIQHAYGVVVFNAPQPSNAVITADFAHIDGTSAIITNLNSAIEQINGEVELINTNVAGHEGRIATLEAGGGGTGGTGGTSSDVKLAEVSGGGKLGEDDTLTIPAQDIYLTNSKTGLASDAAYTPDIATASNLLEFFPLQISERVIVDKMKITITKQNLSNVKGLMGIFSVANGLPYKRLAYTAQYDEVVSTIEQDLVGGEIALEPGLYYLGRFSSGATQYSAINYETAIEINVPADMTTNIQSVTKPGAIRTTWTNNAALPVKVGTAGAIALGRKWYSAPQIHVKKAY